MLRQAQDELQNAEEKGERNLRPWQSKVEGMESLIRTSSAIDGAEFIETTLHIMNLSNLIFVGIPGELSQLWEGK